MTEIQLPGDVFEGFKWLIIKPPLHGSLSFFSPHSGVVYYAPVPGFTGNDDFTYKYGDAVGTVSITVVS